ncbi:MAG: radical SAM protein [Candidatus Omnitrophota bacterium]
MNILLISPNLITKNIIRPRFPPYLSLSVAAHLEDAGFNVKVYDALLEKANINNISNVIDKFNPFLIGISPADIMRVIPFEDVVGLIRFLKCKFKNIPLLVFGIRDKNVIKNLKVQVPEIDYVLMGDPEEVIVELSQGIKFKKDIKNIQGLVLKNHSEDSFSNVLPRTIDNLDKLFFPAWHLIDLNRYPAMPLKYKTTSRVYPITTTRGCPWDRCIFCKDQSILKSSHYRVKSVEKVVSEIEFAIDKYNNPEILFFDSNFNTDIEWLNKFRQQLKERNIYFTWSCLSRVDKLSREAVKIMHDIGCWNIIFGLESSSSLLLDTIDKGCTLLQMKEALHLCQEAGIEITGNFLIGLPGEQPSDVINSAKFAVNAGLDYVAFFIAKWYDDHENLIYKDKGTFTDKWDYSYYDFSGPVFVPRAYNSIYHLKNIQRRAYLIFYTHPRIILKHLKKIRSFADFKRLFLSFMIILKIYCRFVN